jgi:hypothetical protein
MAIEEEFSIEIPDKEADAIHSGMLTHGNAEIPTDGSQLTRRSPTSALSQMLTRCTIIEAVRADEELQNQ